MHLSVKADDTVPVPGAQLSMRGQLLGTTNQAGELDTQLRGFDGERLPLELTCPDGFTPNPQQSTLTLHAVQGAGEERRPIVHGLGCQPLKRDAVIVVHASGAGAPVGQTDGLGYGHFHVRTDPGARFEVAIDTSSNGKLMPQNPHEVFQLEQRDDLFVFEQHFKLLSKPQAPHKRGKPAPKPVTVAPVR